MKTVNIPTLLKNNYDKNGETLFVSHLAISDLFNEMCDYNADKKANLINPKTGNMISFDSIYKTLNVLYALSECDNWMIESCDIM